METDLSANVQNWNGFEWTNPGTTNLMMKLNQTGSDQFANCKLNGETKSDWNKSVYTVIKQK